MSLKSDDERYGAVAQALHWSIAFLLLLMVLSGYLSGTLPKATIVPLHKATGILVLGLTVIRLLWWGLDPNRPGDEMLGWEKIPARLVKWALLFLGLALPLSGWMMSSAAGRPISFYGISDVPLLIGPDRALAGTFYGLHGILALILVAAAALHVAGALRHGIILKDGVLLRMMPAHRRGRSF